MVSGVSELADMPGQRGADPRGKERRAGHGVRRRARVEPHRRRGRGATDPRARDQGHQNAHRGVLMDHQFLYLLHDWSQPT